MLPTERVLIPLDVNASSLQLVAHARELAQRSPTELPEALLHAVGCSKCRGTGYYGRIGVFEVVLIGGEVEAAIANGAPENQRRALLRSLGSPSLVADALMKAQGGITSMEESQEMKWI